MKFLLACFLVSAVSASYLDELVAKFDSFKLAYGKTYSNQTEELKRFNIFAEKLRAIEEHNVLYSEGLISYEQGINQFTDLTNEELRALLTLSAANKPNFNTTIHVKTGLTIPDSIDWRTKGQVTGVKFQGFFCGSCWAFSVIGATEGAYFRKSGKLVSLSEQQLVDCSTKNHGCKGGDLPPAFDYIKEYGIQSEHSYPYKAVDDACKFSTSDVVTKISNYTSIKAEDEDALLDAVANVGPVSVAIDAMKLFSYKGGIYVDDTCSTKKLNHGVLIVGYGSEKGKDFWIVKNSWGTFFGEGGYFKMPRGKNYCGIAEEALYPAV